MKRIVALLSVSLIVGYPAVASANGPTVLVGAAWAQNRVLEYTWAAGHAPPSSMQTAINSAASHSNGSQASLAADFAPGSGEGQVGYEMIGTNWGCGATNAIACEFRGLSGAGWFHVNLREHGVTLVNPGGSTFVMRWCEVSPTPTNCWDTEYATLHELGQVLGGTGHHGVPDYTDSVMQSPVRNQTSVPNDGWNDHAWRKCDVARWQLLYNVSETHPISDCLITDGSGMSTVTSMAPPPTTCVGDPLTFVAHLGIGSSPSYGVLADNNLSSRTSVKLWRAPVGTSNWVEIGSMSGSAGGSYTRVVTASITYKWYVAYTAATTEGLLNSATPAYTVSVIPSPPC